MADIREDEARIIWGSPSDGAEQPDVVNLDTLQAGNLTWLEEKNIGEDEVRII